MQTQLSAADIVNVQNQGPVIAVDIIGQDAKHFASSCLRRTIQDDVIYSEGEIIHFS